MGDRILIVAQDADIRATAETTLEQDGYEVEYAEDLRGAYEAVLHAETHRDVILCERPSPRTTASSFLSQIYTLVRGHTPVIVVCSRETSCDAVTEIRRGALTAIEFPWQPEAFLETISRALEQRALFKTLQQLEQSKAELVRKNQFLVTQNADFFEQARMDVLTGLPNRRRLIEDFEVLDANIQRYKQRFAIAIVDVDAFGRFNKAYGLSTGDEVLTLVARTLRDACRKGDLVYRTEKQAEDPAYRWGGDEFVLVLAAQTTRDAYTAMKRIQHELAEVQRRGRPDIPVEAVTISVGVVANGPEAPLSMEEMLSEAGEWLKAAKAAGGNCIRPLPPQDAVS